MLKSMRKYRQWFLAVGGALLMVTFLFSGTSQMFRPDPEKMVIAEVSSGRILRKDQMQAAREFEALKAFAPMLVRGQLGIENDIHWMLLVREAKEAGLVASQADGPAWIPDLARDEVVGRLIAQYGRQLVGMLGPEYIEQQATQLRGVLEQTRPQAAAQARLQLDEFDAALSKLRGVVRLVNSFYEAPRLSDRQAIAELRREADSVYADAVVIPGSLLAGEIGEPNPEQVAAQFETFKGVKPGSGEMGFGYVQPNRVKLEWIHIDVAAVAAAYTPDPVAVSKHFQLNRVKYPGEFSAEKSKVEGDLRTARRDEAVAEFERLYLARVRSALRGLPTQGSLRTLPPDWESQRPSMTSLAGELAAEVSRAAGFSFPTPSVTAPPGWTRVDRASELPGLGAAQYSAAGQRAPFAQVLATLSDFEPTARLGLQTRVPFEQRFEGTNGDRYYLCVTAARTESAPDSIDEVRADVVRDLKEQGALKRLRDELPTLQAVALTDGLEAVAAKFAKAPAAPGQAPTPGPEVLRDVVISSLRVSQPTLDEPEVRDAAMEVFRTLGPTAEPGQVNLPVRTLAVAMPKQRSVAVVQVTYPKAFSEDDMRLMGPSVMANLRNAEVREAAGTDRADPFSFDSVKKRAGFRAPREAN